MVLYGLFVFRAATPGRWETFHGLLACTATREQSREYHGILELCPLRGGQMVKVELHTLRCIEPSLFAWLRFDLYTRHTGDGSRLPRSFVGIAENRPHRDGLMAPDRTL
jgi:hypothetical protein